MKQNSTTSENQLNRREFLAGTLAGAGILLIGINSSGCKEANHLSRASDLDFIPNSFLRISKQDGVEFFLHKVEMGQGVISTLPFLIAEELDLPIDKIQIRFAGMNHDYRDPESQVQITGGSTSLKSSLKPLREAAAMAKAKILAAASKRWNLEQKDIQYIDGNVKNLKTNEVLFITEFSEQASKIGSVDFQLKPQAQWKYLGKPQKRPDILQKITGQAKYGIDTHPKDAVIAFLLRGPFLEAKLKSFDASDAAKMPGVAQVIQYSNGVAILAKTFHQAREASFFVKTEWENGLTKSITTESIREDFTQLLNSQEGKSFYKQADAEKVFSATPDKEKLDVVYECPYLAHATLEPQNASAFVTNDSVEIWAPTQSPEIATLVAFQITGVPKEKITIHQTFLGGGFGRRLYQDYIAEAVELSYKTKLAVKVMWSREDDMKHDFYRPMTMHRLQGSVDLSKKEISSWSHKIVGQSLLSKTIREWLPSIVPDFLPEGLKNKLASLAGSSIEGLNFDNITAEGAAPFQYKVKNVSVKTVLAKSAVPIGFWRSVGNSYNGFVVESFVDELANLAGMDPAVFRKNQLEDPRALKVLQTALDMSDWSNQIQKKHLGLAVHKSFGTYVAEVAEVQLTEKGFKVVNVFVAVDCGLAINPDTVVAQMQGGVIFALSAAMYGKIEFKDGTVVQSNFDDYQVIRHDEAPNVEVRIIESNEKSSGVGEPGVPPLAAAVANAYFKASGKRLRKLPLLG